MTTGLREGLSVIGAVVVGAAVNSVCVRVGAGVGLEVGRMVGISVSGLVGNVVD